MRRHTNDALTCGDKALLKAPRDVPAILDRPHALVIQVTRPAQRVDVPALVGVNLAGATYAPGAIVDSRKRVCVLVRVRPDHDHL